MRLKKINIFFLVSFLLIGNCLFASQPSAKPKPKLNYLDSLKVMAFINLGWKYSSDYMIKSLSCADLAYYYAHEMKWKNGETEALLLKARVLDYLVNYKDALLIDLLALKTSIELKDSIQLARALRQTAGMYNTQSKINYSIQLLNASIDISRKIKFSKGLGSALSDLASIYIKHANYKQAIPLLNESVLLKIKIHDSLNLSNSYRKLSMAYFEIGLYEKSIDYIFKSIKLGNQINNQKQQSFAYYQ